MSEQPRIFEVDLIVRAHGQPDATVHREYTSPQKASTDGAAGEVWAGVSDEIKARMTPVADGE